MGEYANIGGVSTKIGTCDDMYYLRYEDRGRARPMPGSLDPSKVRGLRYRLPFPDEDHVQIGHYDQYNRGAEIRGFDGSGMDDSPGIIQLRHDCGLLVNAPCYHGHKLPELGGARVFWNGKGTFFVLSSVKEMEDGTLAPVVRCRYCGVSWRVEWADVLPHVSDAGLRARLEAYAAIAP